MLKTKVYSAKSDAIGDDLYTLWYWEGAFYKKQNEKRKLWSKTMELNVNSPAYFTEYFGIDDEVYKFCRRAYAFFKDKESIRFLYNKSTVCIVVRMDFENYCNGDSTEKVEQIREMILAAVKRIKSKGKFDYDQFARDLLSLK